MNVKGSNLKVLRAVVALERFTVADVVGWTGLRSTQVIPQLARLQKDTVIERDKDRPGQTDKPRPAHRPVRHYRVTSEAAERQKAFGEIRLLRAALGEDPIAQRLSIIQGRLDQLKRLLNSSREKKLALDSPQRTEYEFQIRSIENVLDEATLEIEAEDKELMGRVRELRRLRDDLSAALLPEARSAVAEPVPQGVELAPAGMKLAASVNTELRHWLHRLSIDPRRSVLAELEGVSAGLRPIAEQIIQLREAAKHFAPDYNPEARLEYALSRIAAEVVPEPDILLSTTENLLRVVPEKDRSVFEYNYGNLMAWAGRDADAFEHWERSVMGVRSIEAPFRMVIGGFVDSARLNEKVVEELESAARASQGVISIASSTALAGIDCQYSPAAALSDPFLETIELAVKAPDARYVVYGLLFRDLFRSQPGVSYSRLATAMVRGGAEHHQAWGAARRVNSGEILVLLGHFGDSPAESDIRTLKSLLESKLSAEIVDLRPKQDVYTSASAVAG